MKSKLKGIPETLLISLYAKAVETAHKNPIIEDKKAVEIISEIDYDFSKSSKSWMTQVGVSVRTMLFDNEPEKEPERDSTNCYFALQKKERKIESCRA